MWWSRTLFFVLAVSACGFEPVNTGPASALRSSVAIAEPEDRNAFLLVQRLEERLGRSSIPAFALDHTIRVSAKSLGIDAEGDVRRFNLVGQVDWTLREIETGEVRASGVVENFTGYSATGTTVATLTAERDARQRLMVILADQIVQRIQAQASAL